MPGWRSAKFSMVINMISTWAIVIPLSFMSAFWWHWSVVGVVIMIQVRSGIQRTATFIHFRSYKWVKKLTREDA